MWPTEFRDNQRLLEGMVNDATQQWSALSTHASKLVEALACRLEGSGEIEGIPIDAVRHGAELVLAVACAQNIVPALQILEQEYVRAVPFALGRIDSSAQFAEEVQQQLRERLLLGTVKNGRPRILSYEGRGPLGGFLRVMTIRLALNLKAGPQYPKTEYDLVTLALPAEETVAKDRYTEPFQAALRVALSGLSARERNLLRLRFVDNWSPEAIGRSYGVHRATVARWIAAARDAVRDRMIEDLRRTMGFEAGEVESLLHLVESRLHLSLSRLL